MKVKIKDMSVNMELGSKGVEFEIRNKDNHHLGDLIISKGNVEWCQGRTQKGNGVKMKWNKFIKLLNEGE